MSQINYFSRPMKEYLDVGGDANLHTRLSDLSQS